MKRFKEMSQCEFNTLKKQQKKIPFSNFAKFHNELCGYKLYLNGKELLKWRAFINGYDNAQMIIRDFTPIKCVPYVINFKQL